MKGLKLLFAVFLAPLVFQAAGADDASDIARAATRRGTTNTMSSNRQKTNTETKTSAKNTAVSRTTNIQSDDIRDRTTNRATNNTRAATDTPQKNVSARTTTIQPRTIKTTATRTTTNRTPDTTRTTTSLGRTATISRTATMASRTPNRTRAGIARTATDATSTTASAILDRNYSKCREVFHSCMDEFCANKDSQLKRCACSSRTNEFNSTKKNLAQVEEKLLDFSQRLLTVNMEKEDAAALYTATEGELAFAAEDTSESKKMLDEIAKKLNTSFNDNNFDQSLNAISLSLNMDAAFDSVDSLAGASTTAKSGTELYRAALPVCREMAMEVCTSSDDLDIAESSYQMVIEQDCNTVAKSYQTQVDQARTKVFESGALLDMSRLNIYQQRNSDDILTCKQKMLEMLTNSTICGENLGKCLDTTGRYIDPTTGAAFLTTELANLSNLISRPEADQTWTTAPGNERFVSYLNSKKIFLEPAMENCQDISDYVWDAFIEDALAQIKLAQDKKLEEMRQSCTTLTTQCLDETADSIAEFDARALSIFGVAADKTVNAMCEEVRTACTALMKTSGGATDWTTGMTQIAANKTYETILQTCREVGKNCIIQACTSISGNFGLCENIDTSINRKSIIRPDSECRQAVEECIESAGAEKLAEIRKEHPLGDNDSFYYEMYGISNADTDVVVAEGSSEKIQTCISSTDKNCVFDTCYTECSTDKNSIACYQCRLTERIWGNCEVPPSTLLSDDITYHNVIKKPLENHSDTLLWWFSKNTGTSDETILDSCRDTTCGAGYVNSGTGCVLKSQITGDGTACAESKQFDVYTGHNNCCESNIYDTSTNCCQNGAKATTTRPTHYFGNPTITGKAICVPSAAYTNSANVIAQYSDGTTTYNVVCLGNISTESGAAEEGFPNGKSINCNGPLVFIDSSWRYNKLTSGTSSYDISLYFNSSTKAVCKYDSTSAEWKTCSNSASCAPENSTLSNWYISYTNACATE